ncbi:hypothetical protein [Streptomyces sp. TLI_105]|uniref:hypothetical protein n=1 Tax=Streptomyces sp. TLI_105 TaxID=1881019 RepID=UPI000B870846|nr:hypothetical protein [Streptomyces sp. TLI_105]
MAAVQYDGSAPPSPTGVPAASLGKLPLRWGPPEVALLKSVVVTLPPLIAAPPLTSCPSPREQPTVAVCPVEAVFGPLTSVKCTAVETCSRSMPSVLQIAYA